MKIGGLFSGIGGFERGFQTCGFESSFMCEVDEACRLVLKQRFPDARHLRDIRTIRHLPFVDVLTAGFPCQDFSPAGKTAGITGRQGSLFDEIIRIIELAKKRPPWIVLENVPFILHLGHGEAMLRITAEFERLGYRWAYRVVDAISFGLPQRRRRWLFVASNTGDPREVLFADERGAFSEPMSPPSAYGFYWTEGTRGLGLAPNAIPPLKVGSGFGIPTSPAIWDKVARSIVTPHLNDAEALQGFPRGWTSRAAMISDRVRWKLVGNAISVPVARWLAANIVSPRAFSDLSSSDFTLAAWPQSAWGEKGIRKKVEISEFPATVTSLPILAFLRKPATPLSIRASSGFLKRLGASKLRFPVGFMTDIQHHIDTQRELLAEA